MEVTQQPHGYTTYVPRNSLLKISLPAETRFSLTLNQMIAIGGADLRYNIGLLKVRQVAIVNLSNFGYFRMDMYITSTFVILHSNTDYEEILNCNVVM